MLLYIVMFYHVLRDMFQCVIMFFNETLCFFYIYIYTVSYHIYIYTICNIHTMVLLTSSSLFEVFPARMIS